MLLFYLYHLEKYKKKQYKSNKLKLIAPMWNDEFEFPDGSYSESDIQVYIEYIIKKLQNININFPYSCLHQQN